MSAYGIKQRRGSGLIRKKLQYWKKGRCANPTPLCPRLLARRQRMIFLLVLGLRDALARRHGSFNSIARVFERLGGVCETTHMAWPAYCVVAHFALMTDVRYWHFADINPDAEHVRS